MRIIARGAEAVIYLREWHGEHVIEKRRIEKKYRVRNLDERLRYERTKKEAKLLRLARESGVPTPIVLDILLRGTSILMEYIPGKILRDMLDGAKKEDRDELCARIGDMIGKLHNKDIIHGDLTTSNMIFHEDLIYFIDFGLGEISNSIEDKGVDLHLMREAFYSTHHSIAESCYSSVIDSYLNIMDKEVVRRVEEIEKRGRYAR
ncbi:MAG: KEOPS complex kinase/ATPase Bud32 [Candidatus Hydrothermarchaeota archaeon]